MSARPRVLACRAAACYLPDDFTPHIARPVLTPLRRFHALLLLSLAACASAGASAQAPASGAAPIHDMSNTSARSSSGVESAPAMRQMPALRTGISTADSAVAAWVDGGKIPGAVLLVARDGRVVHDSAFGYAQLYDYDLHRLARPVAMHTATLFDLASVTKVMATTFAVMLLVDRGKVDLDAPLHRYLPEFRGPHKDSITVRHLLTHTAGLVQWQPLYYHAHTARETYQLICRMPLEWGVGEGRHYSDLGFMLLGYLVERVSGRPLDVFVHDELYTPLGLHSTTFRPKAHGFHDFAATSHGNPYERHMVYDSTFGYRYLGDPRAWDGWRRYTLVGEVSDGNAWYANGGVAGHAGLFSNAADLHVLLELLLNHGEYHGRHYVRSQIIDEFLTRDRYGNGLGWMMSPDLPDGSFFHTGFTGTYVLGVPKYHLAVVLLTNRENMGTNAAGYYPDVNPLRDVVARALIDGAATDSSRRASRRTPPSNPRSM